MHFGLEAIPGEGFIYLARKCPLIKTISMLRTVGTLQKRQRSPLMPYMTHDVTVECAMHFLPQVQCRLMLSKMIVYKHGLLLIIMNEL